MNEKTVSSGIGFILIIMSLIFTIYGTVIYSHSPITSALLKSTAMIFDIVIVILLLYLVSTIDKSPNYKLNIIILLILLLLLEVYFREIRWVSILINIINFLFRGYLILEFIQYEWKPSKELDILKIFEEKQPKKKKEEHKKEEPKKEEPKKEEPKKEEESMSEKNRQKFRDILNSIGKENLTKSSREDGFEIIDKYKKTDELTVERVKEAVSKLRYNDGSEVKWSDVS